MVDILPYSQIHIGAFRGLRDLCLDECAPVNVLVGGNNSGKTSVLEALLLLADPTDIDQWIGAVELRRAWPFIDLRFRPSTSERLDALTWLFPRVQDQIGAVSMQAGPAGFRATVEAMIGVPPLNGSLTEAELVEGGPHRGRSRNGTPESEAEVPGLVITIDGIRLGPVPTFRMQLWERGQRPRSRRSRTRLTAFATPISHRSDGYLTMRVSRLLRAKKKTGLIELLRRLDPRIEDLTIVTPEESDGATQVPRSAASPTLHVEYKDVGLVPVHAMGDGIRRAMHFAALLQEIGPDGILLVDEIEVGMHTSVLQDVFGWMCGICLEMGVQVFVTTHSLEAVDAILLAVPDSELALYRLKDGKATRFGGDLLRISRLDFGQEVR